MTNVLSPVQAILDRHNISDPDDFIEKRSDNPRYAYSLDPTVRVVGSIQLMKRRFTSREKFARILAALRWF